MRPISERKGRGRFVTARSPILALGTALGLRPRRALSSAQGASNVAQKNKGEAQSKIRQRLFDPSCLTQLEIPPL